MERDFAEIDGVKRRIIVTDHSFRIKVQGDGFPMPMTSQR